MGNCASSFVQGLHFYRDRPENEPVPGLMHRSVGTYGIEDIEVAAAFDVNAAKVGQDLSHALLAEPNNTHVFAPVPETGVTVQRGPTLDGLGRYVRDMVSESEQEPVDVARALRESGTDVLVSYLPVGSQRAAEYYAEQALAAGCAFVNCMPVFIASDPQWERRFAERGLPIIGDDIKSQVGATILHRTLVNLFKDRGVRLDRTYQLNFGGNADFQNMLERERLAIAARSGRDRGCRQRRRTGTPAVAQPGQGDGHVAALRRGDLRRRGRTPPAAAHAASRNRGFPGAVVGCRHGAARGIRRVDRQPPTTRLHGGHGRQCASGRR